MLDDELTTENKIAIASCQIIDFCDGKAKEHEALAHFYHDLSMKLKGSKTHDDVSDSRRLH